MRWSLQHNLLEDTEIHREGKIEIDGEMDIYRERDVGQIDLRLVQGQGLWSLENWIMRRESSWLFLFILTIKFGLSEVWFRLHFLVTVREKRGWQIHCTAQIMNSVQLLWVICDRWLMAVSKTDRSVIERSAWTFLECDFGLVGPVPLGFSGLWAWFEVALDPRW